MPLTKILLAGDGRLRAFADPPMARETEPVVVGWREWASLPGLGIARIQAKVDTGARTSALHADSIERFEQAGESWVRFDVTGEVEAVPWHEAPVADRRTIRSSNGEAELRFVIRTQLELAGQSWPVEITLTNRERMELPMLIGREALAGRALVDSAQSWLWGRPNWRKLRSRRSAEAGPRRLSSGDRP